MLLVHAQGGTLTKDPPARDPRNRGIGYYHPLTRLVEDRPGDAPAAYRPPVEPLEGTGDHSAVGTVERRVLAGHTHSQRLDCHSACTLGHARSETLLSWPPRLLRRNSRAGDLRLQRRAGYLPLLRKLLAMTHLRVQL